MQGLVFTDLDGTLLDHADYSYAAAAPALRRLAALDWPLIFVTSKTRAEVEALQHEMGQEAPFIVENGGGVFFPPVWCSWDIPHAEVSGPYRAIRLGRTYREIRAFVADLAPRFGVRGFGDMSVEEIAQRTGLPPARAALARQREFTEPFLVAEESALAALAERAAASDLAITTGGRFHHLVGARQGKGRAVRAVIEVFRRNGLPDLVTIGLGDAPNDRGMLDEVDVPIVIPAAARSPLRLDRNDAVEAREPGPRGWNEAVLRVVDRLLADAPGQAAAGRSGSPPLETGSANAIDP